MNRRSSFAVTVAEPNEWTERFAVVVSTTGVSRMKILTAFSVAVGLAALAACNQSPQEQKADNIEANAENVADNIEANAENVTDNMQANAENTADQVRNEGEQKADAVRNTADADGNSAH
jgi:hypothetical protein